jgi:hypothetical protein
MAELNAARDAMRGLAGSRSRAPAPTPPRPGRRSQSRRSAPTPTPAPPTPPAPPPAPGAHDGAEVRFRTGAATQHAHGGDVGNGYVGSTAEPPGQAGATPTDGATGTNHGDVGDPTQDGDRWRRTGTAPRPDGYDTDDPGGTGDRPTWRRPSRGARSDSARPRRAAHARRPDWRRRVRFDPSGARGFAIVAGLGVAGATLVLFALWVIIAAVNALSGSGAGNDKVPAAAFQVGDCVAQAANAQDALRVDCTDAHLGQVTSVVDVTRLCPDGSDFNVTVVGDPFRYCIRKAP